MQKYLIAALRKIVIEADFKSVTRKFIDQGVDQDEVTKTLETFKELRDKQKIIKLEEKNIDYWGKKPFEEFKSFVNQLLKSSSKTSIKKDAHKKHEVAGAEFIIENEDWLVYKVNNYEASKLLGSRNWCIVRKKLDFESHSKTLNFYYILSKTRDREDKWYKIALGVDYKGRELFWDNFNDPSDGTPNIPSDLNIPSFDAKYEYVITIAGKSYTEQEFLAAKGLKVIGDLDLSKTLLTSLPENLYVQGYLLLNGSNILTLPKGLTVGGYLNLEDTKIKSLPSDLKLYGGLNLQGTSVTILPKGLLEIKKDLDLKNSKITSLPEGLTVGGNLGLRGTELNKLPKGLNVGGNLSLPVNITELPEDLKVGGSLNLNGTNVTELPKNLVIGRDLFISKLINSLPNGLKVGGDLSLYGTNITSLPIGLKVGGDLNLYDTEITDLPNDLRVGNLIIKKTKIFELPNGLSVRNYIYVDDVADIKCSDVLKKQLRVEKVR